MPAPVILTHIAKAGRDTALGGDRVRPGRKDLGYAGCFQPALRGAKRGAQTRAASTHDHNVELMINEGIFRHIQMAPPARPLTLKATLRIENTAKAPPRPQTNILSKSKAALLSDLWI